MNPDKFLEYAMQEARSTVTAGQTPRQQPTVADLFRSRNVLVRNVLVAWQHGSFPSLESALIVLAAHLAHDNDRLMARAVMEMEKATTITVPKV